MVDAGEELRGTIHTLERGLHEIFTVDFWDYLRKWIPWSILIGVVGGCSAIVFEVLLSAVVDVMLDPDFPRWTLLVVPAIGGLIVGLIAMRVPEAAGPGGNKAIEALHHKGSFLAGLPIPFKILTSAVTIGSGGSAGREGPMAFIGASLASVIGRRLGMSRQELRVFLISGMAAMFSAAFKAPLGCAIFAMELPYKNDLESNAIIPSLISSVTAYIIFIPIFGTDPVFKVEGILYGITTANFPFVILVGLAVGLFGVLFIKLFLLYVDKFEAMSVPIWARIALGGLLTGIIGFAIPEALGLGQGTIQEIIDGMFTSWAILIALLVAKMMATIFTISSGGSGGVFFPSIFMGAILGGGIAAMFGLEESALYAVIGMGAMMACLTKSPVSAPVMITEMVGGYGVLVPLIVASVISYIITGRNTIYTKQITRRTFEYDPSMLADVRVETVMTPDVVSIPPDETLREASVTALLDRHYAYPVVSEGVMVGVVARDHLERAAELQPWESVSEIMHTHFETIESGTSTMEAFEEMNDKQIARMFVIEGGMLVGVLTRIDILDLLEHLDQSHERI